MPPVHRPRCLEYRRAYREAYGRLSAAVCCCSSDDDEPVTAPPYSLAPKETRPMDMPCVWCLLWLNTAPEERPVRILAWPYGALAEDNPLPVEIRGWAHAEELRYGSQYHLRDEHGTYFGLDAKTLAGGDAVCIPHAVSSLRVRAGL